MSAVMTEPPRQMRRRRLPLTVAALLKALDGIPPERVRLRPPPGMATIRDLERSGKPICELIRGTLVEKPMGAWEASLAGDILAALKNWVTPRRLGWVVGPDGGMRFGEDVRLPDVSFISVERLPTLDATTAAYPAVAPDLAVEVISPGNRRREIARKLATFFAHGTRLAWVVYPRRRTAEVHRPGAEPVTLGIADTLDGGDVLPGFALPLAVLFPTDAPPAPA